MFKFTSSLDSLQEFVRALSQRSFLTSTSTLRDKVKLANLELSLAFQEFLTSICLIYDEMATKELTNGSTLQRSSSNLNVFSSSSSSPLLQTKTRRMLSDDRQMSSSIHLRPITLQRAPSALSLMRSASGASLLRSRSYSMPENNQDKDNDEEKSLMDIESIQILSGIKDSAVQLRELLKTYLAELSARNKVFKEDSREGIITSGMTHLLTKIDASMIEVRTNEVKIIESLASNSSVATNAANFHQTLAEFIEFFKDFSNAMYFKFTTSVKKKLQLINLIFSSRWNHFMTSVCLNANINIQVSPAGSSPFFDDGIKYLHGIGVPRNLQLAYSLFLEGAEAGDMQCMENLAVMYQQGTGVEADVDSAQKWLQSAISLGSASAKCSMALLLVGEIQDSEIDAGDREILLQHAISLLLSAADEVFNTSSS